MRREFSATAGVSLIAVDYLASQAWPFPAGLMVGFRGTAASESVTADGKEILEARWFTRAERSAARRVRPPARPGGFHRPAPVAFLA